MNRNVKTIGREKFSNLSSRRQHELLVGLGKECLLKQDYSYFRDRYKKLQSWAQIDRYSPPLWLSYEEALHEYIAFHNNFSMLKTEIPDDDLDEKQVSWQAEFSVEVVLDQVRSPYNTGSILRLIDNYGFKGLAHSSSRLSLDHPQLKRAARGCQNWIPVNYVPDLVGYLKESDVPVIGIEDDESAVFVNKWKPPEECILILGNETYGIASNIRMLCDHIVCIPVFGFKKSMNVHHALAVAAQRIVESCN